MVKTYSCVVLNSQRLRMFLPSSGSKARVSAFLSLFNIVLEVPAAAIKQEKLIAGIQMAEKDTKPSLFADDVVFCIERPKESKSEGTNKKPKTTTSEFSV